MFRERSEDERRALRAANGADLPGEWVTTIMQVVAGFVALAMVVGLIVR